MKVDPITLKYLLESMNEGIREMQLVMRGSVDKASLQALARVAHKLRGEATVVGFANLSQLIVSMENALERMQMLRKIDKSQLQPLSIYMLKIVKVCAHIRNSAAQSHKSMQPKLSPVSRQQAARAVSANRTAGVTAVLQVLANNVAMSYGKQVTLNLDKFNIAEVPASLQMKVQDIVFQLVRNAIAHGIELPNQRKQRGKNTGGTVAVIARRTENDLIIAVRDNGRGINLEEIRRKLVMKFKYGVLDAAKLSRDALLNSLFMPGFSTVVGQQQHAGRGVGLDLVKEYASAAGGFVDVSFKENQYAQFIVRIPLQVKRSVAPPRPTHCARVGRPPIAVPTLTDFAQQ